MTIVNLLLYLLSIAGYPVKIVRDICAAYGN
jgi:hypothetical protein